MVSVKQKQNRIKEVMIMIIVIMMIIIMEKKKVISIKNTMENQLYKIQKKKKLKKL